MRKAIRAFVLFFTLLAILPAFSEAAPRLPENLRTTPAPIHSNAEAIVSDVSEALSARPDASFYVTARIDDLNGVLRKIFSQESIDMVTAMLPPDEAGRFRERISLAAAVVSQVPAESAAFILGVDELDKGGFLQIAVSVSDDLRPELDRTARGEAAPEDIIALLGGRAVQQYAGELPVSEPQQGAKGPYYKLPRLRGDPVLAAKNGLLLIAIPAASLEASIDALDNAESRLSVKRRFSVPNNFLAQIDMSKFAEIPDIFTSDLQAFYGTLSQLSSLLNFKAPLKIEFALDPQPGKFTLSSHMNWLEAFGVSGDDSSDSPRANLFLAGEGQLFSAFAVPTSFSPSWLRAIPEAYMLWQTFVQELAVHGIAGQDVEDLLNGSLSFALGGGSTVMGMRMPGAYIALSGQNGAAAKILSKIIPELPPLTPLEAEGWDALFTVSDRIFPISLLLGASGDTLFFGLANPDGLNKTPELSPGAAALLKEPSVGMGFIDIAAIWNWVKAELSAEDSALNNIIRMGSVNSEKDAALLQYILDSEVLVPFIKMWAPDPETSFLEFSLADVPLEKRLLFKIISAVKEMI